MRLQATSVCTLKLVVLQCVMIRDRSSFDWTFTLNSLLCALATDVTTLQQAIDIIMYCRVINGATSLARVSQSETNVAGQRLLRAGSTRSYTHPQASAHATLKRQPMRHALITMSWCDECYKQMKMSWFIALYLDSYQCQARPPQEKRIKDGMK